MGSSMRDLKVSCFSVVILCLYLVLLTVILLSFPVSRALYEKHLNAAPGLLSIIGPPRLVT